jgi:hypothetical protein
VAFLSYQWRDGVFTLRLELKKAKRRLGARPRPPPFPLPPYPPVPTSWLEVEPTAPMPKAPEPTVIVSDPGATLDGPLDDDPIIQRRQARKALRG